MDAVLPLRLHTGTRTATIDRVSTPDTTDAALIERVAERERDAFEELYVRYARSVLGLALRRLGDRGRGTRSSTLSAGSRRRPSPILPSSSRRA